MRSFDRREFITTSAAAGVGLMTALTASAQRTDLDVEEATIASLQTAMGKGVYTAQQLVTRYVTIIASRDKRVTNSIIEINPDALRIAAQLDRERKAGKLRGPLHGIPVVLKDNIDTADKMKTTAGSLALLDAPVPKQDAFLVTQLRNAGAVVLGKTNLSEWANFRSTASTSGWSGRGGQTRNPYILDRNPCGSSSGTGAAIAANFAAIGIGTETDGSIVCPSSICGIVGIKPTVGLISRSGVIPISASQDTAGPMTRTVADAAVMLNVLDAADPSDPATTAAGKRRERVDYTNFLKADGLKGAVIGVARDYWGKRAEVDKLMDAALDVMKRHGATLVDVKFPGITKFGDAEFEVLQFEFKDGLEKYLAGRGSRFKTLDDLIRFNNENAAREMPHFKQEIFETSAKKGPLTSKEYRDARALSLKHTRDDIDEAMKKYKLDAIVAPSNAPSWMTDLVNGDCGSNYISSSSLAAVSGYPAITVPAGFIRELPIGISFFGRPWSEGDLIKFAYAFEQATKARRKPKFLATVS
ncbi:MAG TPA: amidase [Pyrinomonadaceae bacterium]|nr:amidase [Pyrinomonadaceae bacterium]